MKILQFPLARISISFILGLLFFKFYQPTPLLVFGCLFLCVLVLVILHFLDKKFPHLKIYFGILTLLLSFQIGISTSIIHKETYNNNHYTNQIYDYEKEYCVGLVINEKLKSSPKNNRYISIIKTINGKESFGKIIVNLKKTSAKKELEIGTDLIVEGKIYKNRNPINPNQFDYGRYLENQEIYGQLYTASGQIKIGKNAVTIWSIFSNFRNKIIHHLELSNIKREELNVLIALLVGQQQDIAPEVLKDYQYAGAVHVLSVSGLHVGFILLFVTFILKPIPNSKKGSFFKLLLILTSLWVFGILAGLSPSVVRSVAMFSIVAIGNQLRRTVNTYHTLLVSMLLILLFKPSFLFDIGFQLSYLALFFILWLQPILSSIWTPKNKIVRYFWDIITVSFAAQIGAMPLSIYYFHQFPGLFFITNIIVLPLLGVIMIVGLIAIIVACFSLVPYCIAKPLELLITLLNTIIHWVASFESFIIKNISFSNEMLLVSYLVIVVFILWIEKPNFNRLSIALSSILLLQSIYIFSKYNSENADELIVFNVKKHTIITEKNHNLVSVFSNDSILQSLDNNLTIQPYLVGNFCKVKKKSRLQNLLYFKNKKILIIDSSSVYLEKIKPDILIITNSPKLNLKRLLSVWKPEQIVVDGSNFKSYIKLWESTCHKEKIPFHNTNEKGFYKI
ncbi:ComEC/Rec2 family competence protein [Flavobacterium sp. N1994]|uniref:ComEC/Rec2 family competence protein n=1 Tax=Flavobacterium sp. N1994 TaxID=2986827 RepID=UPI002223A2AE|nr:ComEC/Rec2 family competence protein [Flavobacterium sp. N1994]